MNEAETNQTKAEQFCRQFMAEIRAMTPPGGQEHALMTASRVKHSAAAGHRQHGVVALLRRAAVRRTAPRRLGTRRHRRAARGARAAPADDSGPEPPPPPKSDLIAACAALALLAVALAAGFFAGAGAALALPVFGAVALLTPGDLAERLRCSVSQVRKLSRLGKIETVYVGRLPRYTEAAVDDYVQRSTTRISTLAVARRRGGR